MLVAPLASAPRGYAGEVTRRHTRSLRTGGVEDNTTKRGEDELGEERFKEFEEEDDSIFSASGFECKPQEVSMTSV